MILALPWWGTGETPKAHQRRNAEGDFRPDMACTSPIANGPAIDRTDCRLVDVSDGPWRHLALGHQGASETPDVVHGDTIRIGFIQELVQGIEHSPVSGHLVLGLFLLFWVLRPPSEQV
jgi:hypothetical protein